MDSQTETPSPASTDASTPSTEGAPGPHPVVAASLERIAATVPPERRDALAAFAKAYTKRLTAEELDEMSAGELVAQATGAFELADSRGTEPIAVRAFNPDPSRIGLTRSTVVRGGEVDSSTTRFPGRRQGRMASVAAVTARISANLYVRPSYSPRLSS